jgi:ferredoxin
VTVDRDLCQGHGTCCEEASGVFELDSKGNLVIKVPEPPEAQREAVRLAVKHCPTGALTLQG